MLSVLGGFATVWAVIAVGWLLGRIGMLDDGKQLVLNSLAFYVANPCLLFLMMARADLGRLFAANMAVNVASTLLTAALYLALSLLIFRRGAEYAVVGAQLSCYVNAANLGLPIAAFILHDMTWMAPILLFQLLLLQPAAVTVLDVLEARRSGTRKPWWVNATIPFRNPLTAGTGLGVLCNVLHIKLPEVVLNPLSMIGQMAVPMMLIAFGVSLYVNGLPGRGDDFLETWVTTALKLVVHPAIAFCLAEYVFGLTPEMVLACVIIAGLPSAQNIFVIAQRYRAAVGLARDATFLNTLLSIPSLFLATLLVHLAHGAVPL